MTGRAIIAGGSIGGLFAANALMKAGWEVTVFERVGVELSGRGAGIVTHRQLIEALGSVGATVDDLGVAVEDRVAFDIDGHVVHRLPFPQIVTSWDRIHQLLRAMIPDGAHHLGRAIAGYVDHGDHVTVRFDDGSTEEADLLVGADGFRSAVRGQMNPDIQPLYSGYVVWRALTDEAKLSPDVHDSVFSEFGFFLPQETQIVGYPIAGPGNDLRPGHRRYNFVWYSAVDDSELADMLTDATGQTHVLSIAPPLVREQVLERMAKDARRRLPPAFVEILNESERPFFTPIYDHLSPTFASGHVALIGDAACVARPHVGMGVTKAAEDALALARCLSIGPAPTALQTYSQERQPAGLAAVERARRLGSYIFDPDAVDNQDGRHNPRRDQIMIETASTDFS